MTYPTAKQKFTLQTEDQQRKHKARQAIMAHRLSLGIISENFNGAYHVSDTGTAEQVAALREKWGI